MRVWGSIGLRFPFPTTGLVQHVEITLRWDDGALGPCRGADECLSDTIGRDLTLIPLGPEDGLASHGPALPETGDMEREMRVLFDCRTMSRCPI